MTFIDDLRRSFRAASTPSSADQAGQAAAAATSASIGVQSAAAKRPKPACVSAALHQQAVTLCAQKRVAGHEAVAAFGALGLVDPFMALAPCEWAEIPVCPSSAAPSQGPTQATFVKDAPGGSSQATLAKGAASPALAPAVPPAPASDARLIIGGVLASAIVLGVVFYKLKD